MAEKGYPVLTGDNFLTWRERVKSLLQTRRLWAIVDPGFTEEQLELENAKNQAKNTDALNLLKQCCNDTALHFIKRCKTAATAWKELDTIFCDYTGDDVCDLIEQLYLNKKTEENTMVEYIVKMEETFEKLEAAGALFDSSVQGAFLVKGLDRDKYALFRQQLKATEVTNKSEIKCKLLKLGRSEEIEKMGKTEDAEKKNKEANDRVEAFAVKGRFNKGSGDRPKFVCYTCNEPGHPARVCSRFQEAKKRGTVLCFKCLEFDHTSRYCDKKENSSSGDNNQGLGNANAKANKVIVQASNGENGELKFKAVSMCVSAGKRRSDVNLWTMDSACNEHITPFGELLTDYRSANSEVDTANQSVSKVVGYGTMSMKIKDEHGGTIIKLGRVLHCPDFGGNLLSIRQLDKKGFGFRVENSCPVIYNKTGPVIEGVVKNEMYVFSAEWYEVQDAIAKQVSANVDDDEGFSMRVQARRVMVNIWHQRFGHSNNLPDCDVIGKVNVTNCDVCMEGKMKRLKFPLREERSIKKLELMYSDVCKVRELSIGRNIYFVSFIDDFSRYSFVELLKEKGEVLQKFQNVLLEIENLHGEKLKNFQSDNGKEYYNEKFSEFLANKGIHRRLTTVYTAQQNGVAEKFNQDILSMTRCQLIQSGLGPEFWGESLCCANYIRNRCISSVTGKTPYELWYDKEFNNMEALKIKVFGCKAWAVILPKPSSKLQARGKRCVMVGYAENRSAYRLWDIKGKYVFESRDVRFYEKCFPLNTEHVKNCDFCTDEEVRGVNCEIEVNGSQIIGDVGGPSAVTDLNVDNVKDSEVPVSDKLVSDVTLQNNVSTRPKRNIKSKKPCTCCKVSCDINVVEPKSVEEALSGEFREEWLQAMMDEILSLESNDTWELVKCPEGNKVIKSKWLFKIKRDQFGFIQKFKARLIAQGFHQIKGIDYFESYSPVIKKCTLRLMTALSVRFGWEFKHIDVKCAYLNSDLKENVFVTQPACFIDAKNPEYVCKLRKSMYGLPQSGRNWNRFLDEKLRSLEFVPCKSDPCLYVSKERDLFIGVYVDDLAVWGGKDKVELLTKELSKLIEIRDLGEVSNFIGIKFERKCNGAMEMNQRQYIDSMLKEFEITGDKYVGTTLPERLKCTEAESKSVNPTKYRGAVGSLLHLANCTRPDIMQAVSYVSQKCCDPNEKDWNNVEHLMRYVKSTADLSIIYDKNDSKFSVYSDADFANDVNNRRSYSGFVINLGTVVHWKSKKQPRVSLSTVEAELRAMAYVTKELLWLRVLLTELGLEGLVDVPWSVNCDNKGAICLSENPVVSDLSKHVGIQQHFVRDCVKFGEVEFNYVPSKENLADIMTKPLPKATNTKIRKLLGLM